MKGFFPELCPGHGHGTISYNEDYVVKSPWLALNTYSDKVSTDTPNAAAT